MALAAILRGGSLNFDDGSTNTVQIGTSYTQILDSGDSVMGVLRFFHDGATQMFLSRDGVTDHFLVRGGESRSFVKEDVIINLFAKSTAANQQYRLETSKG